MNGFRSANNSQVAPGAASLPAAKAAASALGNQPTSSEHAIDIEVLTQALTVAGLENVLEKLNIPKSGAAGNKQASFEHVVDIGELTRTLQSVGAESVLEKLGLPAATSGGSDPSRPRKAGM